jgi:NAD+ kinase
MSLISGCFPRIAETLDGYQYPDSRPLPQEDRERNTPARCIHGWRGRESPLYSAQRALGGRHGPSASMNFKTLAFVAGKMDAAQAALKNLQARYDHVTPEEADVIVALGGDGFVLETLHGYMERGIPIYGMNRGSVGFLMNVYEEDDLLERLAKCEPSKLHPLRMEAHTTAGTRHEALAINEVSLLRQTRFAAKIGIQVDGIVRMDQLICDGVLVSTPAGSTAYNNAVQGPILPMGAGVLALSPISAFRPRRWRGAILPHDATVTLDIQEAAVRPVSAVADFTEIRDVARVVVREDRSVSLTLLFDPEHDLEERILMEQFVP